jgi:hypothetical protein
VKCSLIDEYVKKPSAHGMSTFNRSSVCIQKNQLMVNTKSAFEFDNLRKTIIKYYLEKCFGIDVQLKVIDLKF